MASNIDEVTTCAVCFEPFNDPQMLPCQHTFCKSCVDRMKSGSKIKCPTCNAFSDFSLVKPSFLHGTIKAALQEKENEIPTISLAAYRAGTLSADEMQQLARACEDHGFFLLAEHRADELVAEVFQTSQAFFAQPKSEKHKVFRDEINPLGYFDRELTKQKRDLKEVFACST